MISNTCPKVKLGCSDMTNSLCENLEVVKFDKKESMEVEETSNYNTNINDVKFFFVIKLDAHISK